MKPANMAKLTVRELLDGKGRRQFTFVQVTRAEEAIAAERARLQRERVEAYCEYIADVTSGTFPAARHMVDIADDEYEAFLETLECGVTGKG